MEDLKRAREPAPKGKPSEVPVLRRDPAQEALKAEAAETKVLLDAKRRSISELEDFRRRRLAELQTELAQQRAVYADAHPAVARILQSISALQQDSPQLATLRKDEADLQSEYEKLNSRRQESGPLPASAPPPTPAGGRWDPIPGEWGTRLRFAMEYDALLDGPTPRDRARHRAGGSYRYSVVRPATLPKRAVKLKIPADRRGGDGPVAMAFRLRDAGRPSFGKGARAMAGNGARLRPRSGTGATIVHQGLPSPPDLGPIAPP